MSARKSMIAYAMMQAAADRGGTSPAHAVIPLIERAVSGLPDGPSSLSAMSEKFKHLWGFELPINVLRHCLRQNPLRRYVIFDHKRNVYEIASDRPTGTHLDVSENVASEKLKFVRTHLTATIARESDRKISADDVLYYWLDAVAPSFVKATSSPTNFTLVEKDSNRLVNLALEYGSPEIKSKFRNCITDLALGDLLYKSIVYASEYETLEAFEDISQGHKNDRMGNVVVYFDTTLIFWRLGYYGQEMQAAVSELVTMCRATGAQTAVFTHNVDELEAGLKSLAHALGGSSNRNWAAVGYALALGLTRSDILKDADNIEERISDFGFDILEPPQRVEEFQLSEVDLDYELVVGVQQVNEEARLRDVRSIAAIFQLRRGEPIDFLEKCEAIFVTSNSSLAAAATRHQSKEFLKEDKTPGVQWCMTDVVLSARLWTKLPTNTATAPREQILARSASYLKPNSKLRDSFLKKIQNLYQKGAVSEQEFSVATVTNFADRLLALDFDPRTTEITDEQAIQTAQAAVRELARIGEAQAVQEGQGRLSRLETETRSVLEASESRMIELLEQVSALGGANAQLKDELETHKSLSTTIRANEKRALSDAKRRQKIGASVAGGLLVIAALAFIGSELLPAGTLKSILARCAGFCAFMGGIGGLAPTIWQGIKGGK